jgi:hypothetical protein
MVADPRIWIEPRESRNELGHVSEIGLVIFVVERKTRLSIGCKKVHWLSENDIRI